MNNGQKWTLAIIIGLIFLILSSALFYSLINKPLKSIGLPKAMDRRGPTLFGLFLTTLIFIIILRFFVLSEVD